MENLSANTATALQGMEGVIMNSINNLFGTVATHLPNMIAALFIILLGYLFATVLRGTARKIMQWTGLTKAIEHTEVDEHLGKVGINRTLTSMILSVVYWIILLIFLTAAFETLGLSIVVTTLNKLIAYLPNVIGAAIIMVVALLIGRFVRKLIMAGMEQMQLTFGRTIAGVGEVVVAFFGAIIAASLLGLDVTVLTTNLTLILGAVLAAGALSLGLGSRTMTSNLIGGYYTKQLFEIGTEVTLGGHKGKVKKISNVGVLLDTSQGDILIPNEEVVKHGSLGVHS